MMIPDDASLEERVNVAYHRLVAIESVAAAEDDVVQADPAARLISIQELAGETLAVLAPLKDAPFAVAEWRPPSGGGGPGGPVRTPSRPLRAVPTSTPARVDAVTPA